jgi:hypothetical protein
MKDKQGMVPIITIGREIKYREQCDKSMAVLEEGRTIKGF